MPRFARPLLGAAVPPSGDVRQAATLAALCLGRRSAGNCSCGNGSPACRAVRRSALWQWLELCVCGAGARFVALRGQVPQPQYPGSGCSPHHHGGSQHSPPPSVMPAPDAACVGDRPPLPVRWAHLQARPPLRRGTACAHLQRPVLWVGRPQAMLCCSCLHGSAAEMQGMRGAAGLSTLQASRTARCPAVEVSTAGAAAGGALGLSGRAAWPPVDVCTSPQVGAARHSAQEGPQ